MIIKHKHNNKIKITLRMDQINHNYKMSMDLKTTNKFERFIIIDKSEYMNYKLTILFLLKLSLYSLFNIFD